MSQVFHDSPQSFEVPEEFEEEETLEAKYEPPAPEPKALPAQGTPEYDRMRSTGKIVFKPRKIEMERTNPETGEVTKTGEVCIQTHDQQVYSVGKGGQLRNLCKPQRMSKKKRRAWRKKQLEESPAPAAK